ncbi:MAG TPA: helix-turn-helix domain-containing protein [Gaiellaceae bacterium]|nr:helix-turn-helix domain-containing protein [Gaiellaceae bacterium]
MFEIGNSLREARQRRGIDFAQAELATKIRGKYLRALEEEQFEVLPSETYVKGFLRTYADFLGLDGQLYVDEFNARFVIGEERELRPRRSRAKPKRNRRLEAGVVLAALAAIVVLAVVVIAAWSSSGGGKTPTVGSKVRTVTTTVRPPLLTVVPLRGTTHLTVRKNSASGDIAFDGTLLHTDSPVAIHGSRLWVQITNPENVRVLIEGRARHIPGYAPRVILVTPLGWQPAQSR